ncbi:MAG: EAL domain-containing protein [Candidatus Sedimenticola endophacoides]
MALLFLDLDNFKTINDTLGHRAGDELLVLASERMRATLRESDTMFCMSGDEFLVCLEGIGAIREVEVVARKLNRIFASPFALASGEVYASVSIGICLFPDDGTDVEQLMQAADAAMYGAKARGRNTFQLFTRQMREEAEARLAIESQLRRALGSDEFSLVDQPKVEVHSGRIVGAEALLRWDNASLGAVGPERFIPVAEDAGLITDIGRWVIEQACLEAVRWPNDDDISVAVNISSRQFRMGDLLSCVGGALMASGLAPRRLELEITESLLVQDAPETINILNALQRRGVRLALDDFGTGYSSLSYPQRCIKSDALSRFLQRFQ